jgi:hypothetical protein
MEDRWLKQGVALAPRSDLYAASEELSCGIGESGVQGTQVFDSKSMQYWFSMCNLRLK